ncbi:Spo0E family sporulation regulatory protein-aspartic acid phosphatase [Tepidibacillus sp. LV47]|uniref:Spo0E family sporulation regulatory protein-aspartic acid phosphatase n=1 Tax=Tepidibacillus sp. LV47 TaxID=3398228 RepID=UPI003AABE5B6
MKRDLIKEFEKVRKEMEEKGKVLGFQHPLVLELSHRLDRIHNELLKKENALILQKKKRMISHSPLMRKTVLERVYRNHVYNEDKRQYGYKDDVENHRDTHSLTSYPHMHDRVHKVPKYHRVVHDHPINDCILDKRPQVSLRNYKPDKDIPFFFT